MSTTPFEDSRPSDCSDCAGFDSLRTGFDRGKFGPRLVPLEAGDDLVGIDAVIYAWMKGFPREIDGRKVIWPTPETIALELRRPLQMVEDSLRRLIDLGLIVTGGAK